MWPEGRGLKPLPYFYKGGVFLKAKVLVCVLVLSLICAGTVLAHPYNIREDAERPTDAQIDDFIAGHDSDDWYVFGLQFSHLSTWYFRVYAVPQGVTPYEIEEREDRWYISIPGVDGVEYDVLNEDGTVERLDDSSTLVQYKSSGGYTLFPPVRPLQAGMEGAMEIMMNPFRPILRDVMIMMVGLVGFGKAWIWLKRQLWGA